ncbi:gdp-l-fucose synthase 1 [Phtheirospermum japonicum]|uniref:Gdp-l-fucose synthase 1 n=1 Tax=Phtheirospermum japonicum TaxID=374723 RepID=A0A830BCI2_9LAMI|nr:gdp-l-fucose synthase 1 [Phtheirospermum japonicum]
MVWSDPPLFADSPPSATPASSFAPTLTSTSHPNSPSTTSSPPTNPNISSSPPLKSVASTPITPTSPILSLSTFKSRPTLSPPHLNTKP